LAVRIRLTRVGATKRPAYRVIAIDKRRSRDGRALEILGFYDPLTEPATVQLDRARIDAWIGRGAQPSETVV
jgi:small subunit ribosomal protein S16